MAPRDIADTERMREPGSFLIAELEPNPLAGEGELPLVGNAQAMRRGGAGDWLDPDSVLPTLSLGEMGRLSRSRSQNVIASEML